MAKTKTTWATNWKAVILSVIAATIFWFFNALNKEYTTNIRYPVVFLFDYDTYLPIEPLPDNININMSGVGWNLLRKTLNLRVEALQVPLDRPLEVKKITGSSLPAVITDQITDLQLNYVLTDTLFINIDERTTRRYKIFIDSTAIPLEQNYGLISQVILSTDSITLKGPKSVLYSMSDTIFLQITDKEIDDHYEEDLAVNVPNQHLIVRDPPTVNVSFSVEEFVPGTQKVYLSKTNMPENGYILDTLNTIDFNIRESLAGETYDLPFKIEVDAEKMNPEDSTIRPVLSAYPQGLRDIRWDTTSIKLYFNE
ncbi:MAG: hypothetical protein OEX02_02340 [Cyclobacteriaceae bacterium]|nr:hypothetical protein [Cyclobacteriaceae bacterium]